MKRRNFLKAMVVAASMILLPDNGESKVEGTKLYFREHTGKDLYEMRARLIMHESDMVDCLKYYKLTIITRLPNGGYHESSKLLKNNGYSRLGNTTT